MGLDASGSTTDKTYHAGYGTLHWIRYLALQACGFPETFGIEKARTIWPTCFIVPPDVKPGEINDIVQASMLAGFYYPNLMLHSDCDGSYTKNGKPDPSDSGRWLTGNSVGLLKELELLKTETKECNRTGYAWDAFIMLYDMVKDEVENGKGTIRFH